MFSIRFQTMLVIMTTAVATIFIYDMLREQTEHLVAAQQSSKKAVAVPTVAGVTIKLPKLATTSINTVVNVPDGGTILIGSIKRTRQPLILQPASK